MTNPIVILGGGISGLSCAFYLNRIAQNVIGPRKIIVIESAKRLGGYIQTQRCNDGVVHELGPRSLRNDPRLAPNTFEMVEALGLSAEVIGVSNLKSGISKKYIWADGRLIQVPNSFSACFRKQKPILNKSIFSYTISEAVLPRLPVPDYEDITVYDFFRLRYDSNFANYLADPVIRGITAGDCRKLSMKALFPEIFNYQDIAGSIMKGIIKKVRPANEVVLPYDVSDVLIKAQMEKWSTWNFVEGLQRLPDALCDHLIRQPNVQLCNESRVKSLTFNHDGVPAKVVVSTEADDNIELEADYVISALPAVELSRVLKSENQSSIARKLSKIQSVHVAVVCLEFPGNVLKPDIGFGFLTPSFEDSKVLGITFDSSVFPAHDYRKNITRLTVMMGGEWFIELFGPPENVSTATLEQVAIEACRKHLGIQATPKRSFVKLYKDSIPQYRLNHRNLVSQIEDEIDEQNLSLSLTGFSYKGVAVNECIYNSKKLVYHLRETNMKGREQFSDVRSSVREHETVEVASN